jgi:transglutaminase-like putative cysteine protease
MQYSVISACLACLVLSGCHPTQRAAPPPTQTSAGEGESEPADKQRRFTFHYRFRVKDLQPSGDAGKDLVRVWLPAPPNDPFQTVKPLEVRAPAKVQEYQELRFGNRLLYLELPVPAEGGFEVDAPYEVVRREVLDSTAAISQRAETKLTSAERQKLLAADQLVPTSGKPLELLRELKPSQDQLHLARQLYDAVDQHVTYKKEGTGWGRGDTNWVCDSGYGNCTDFHSLFLSLARSQGLPAKFEIGFSIPMDQKEGPIAGYHCWAWFYCDDRQRWVPVDISEADKHPEMKDYYFGNLTADRVVFSTGRDLELIPKNAQGRVNFLIYPYIEVGGEVLPQEQVEMLFGFASE